MVEALAIASMLVGCAVWFYAVWNALQFVLAVPQGKRLSAVFPRWPWNVSRAVERFGPAVERPLRRFQLGFALFFVCIIAVILTGTVGTAFQKS